MSSQTGRFWQHCFTLQLAWIPPNFSHHVLFLISSDSDQIWKERKKDTLYVIGVEKKTRPYPFPSYTNILKIIDILGYRIHMQHLKSGKMQIWLNFICTHRWHFLLSSKSKKK